MSQQRRKHRPRHRPEDRPPRSPAARLHARSGAALLLLAACGHGGAEAPPNILLISIDTLRADHLGCYGHERSTSPNLDELAREGVLFERALSSSSWTLPAHTTMLTGLATSAHGVCDDRLWTRTDRAGRPIPPPLHGRYVSELLERAGYHTAGFFTWKYLEAQFGFGPGFATWERVGHSLFSHPATGPEFARLQAAGDVEAMKALAAAHPELPTEDGVPTATLAVDRALAWLTAESETEAPFFLFLHLFDVHDPYTPPPPYDALFDPDYDGPIDGRRVTTQDSAVRGDMAPRDLEHLIALYDGGVAWVDAELGRLLARLAQLGLAEHTLVIVTADHGEEFFEHGHKTHRRQLHMESIHVPLLMRWPGHLPRGERIAGTVGLVDIAPTICAAAGVAAAEPMMGIDLGPIARGEARNTDRTYLAEMLLFDGSAVPRRQLALARGEELTLLSAEGAGPWRAERFDLAQNPRGAGPGRVLPPQGEDSKAVLEHLARIREATRHARDRNPDRGADLPQLSDHDRRQLAALGYATDGDFGEGDGGRLCLDGCVWPDEE